MLLPKARTKAVSGSESQGHSQRAPARRRRREPVCVMGSILCCWGGRSSPGREKVSFDCPLMSDRRKREGRCRSCGQRRGANPTWMLPDGAKNRRELGKPAALSCSPQRSVVGIYWQAAPSFSEMGHAHISLGCKHSYSIHAQAYLGQAKPPLHSQGLPAAKRSTLKCINAHLNICKSQSQHPHPWRCLIPWMGAWQPDLVGSNQPMAEFGIG